MTFTITGNTSGTSITFEFCSRVDTSVTKNVTTYVFTDDTATILDEGKTLDQIVLTGTDNENFPNISPSSNIYTRMEIINTFMDDQEEISLSGMDDTYLNTDYYIHDFSFNAKPGQPDLYDFTITLERVRDRIPYSEI